jgi:hypothetical protein
VEWRVSNLKSQNVMSKRERGEKVCYGFWMCNRDVVNEGVAAMRNNLTLPPSVIVALILPLWIAACDSGPKVIKWQEDVEFLSGEVIRVNRTAKAKPYGEWGGPGGWENEGMTLQIATPNKPDNPPLWDAKFVPVVFDRDAKTGEWFIVATFVSCESWYDLRRPKLPYTEYRLKNGVWQQGLLSPTSIGLKGNMLTSIRSGGEPPLIDITGKRERMATEGSAEEYKQIVSVWSTTCQPNPDCLTKTIDGENHHANRY